MQEEVLGPEVTPTEPTPAASPTPPPPQDNDRRLMERIHAEALKQRQQYLDMRHRRRPSAMQDSLFDSGDQAMRVANQARLASNYSKAFVYFDVAVKTYRKAINPQSD